MSNQPDINVELTEILNDLKECVAKNRYFEIPPGDAKILLDAFIFATVHGGHLAAAQAHRAVGSEEHAPFMGKLHGCCAVCNTPWPCETASYFLRKAEQ